MNNGDTVPQPQLFPVAAEWPEEIIVEPSRLASGIWGEEQGDISAAYCADTLPKVQAFAHQGQLYINCGGPNEFIDGYPLLPPEHSNPTLKKPYSHEGMAVNYEKRPFALGQKIIFKARPRTVEEEVSLLRRQYAYGGYFVAGKTYQEMLLEFLDGDQISEGLKTAIQAELARAQLPKTQPEMLAELGKLPEPSDRASDDADEIQPTLPGMQ